MLTKVGVEQLKESGIQNLWLWKKLLSKIHASSTGVSGENDYGIP